MILVFYLSLAYCVIGFDTAELASYESLHCIRKKGLQFVIFRATTPNGRPDPNLEQNLKRAGKTGLDHISLYLIPCHQRNFTLDFDIIRKTLYKADFNGVLWLAVEENNDCPWQFDSQANCVFVKEIAYKLMFSGRRIGIRSNKYAWDSIVGDCVLLQGVHLWLNDPRNRIANFGGYSKFGGWSFPLMKQYRTDTLCNLPINFNFIDKTIQQL